MRISDETESLSKRSYWISPSFGYLFATQEGRLVIFFLVCFSWFIVVFVLATFPMENTMFTGGSFTSTGTLTFSGHPDTTLKNSSTEHTVPKKDTKVTETAGLTVPEKESKSVEDFIRVVKGKGLHKHEITAIFFDFDGVLAIPHTHPEVCYEKICLVLRGYHTKHKGKVVFFLCSYNPKALSTLERWGIDDLFPYKRAGCNDVWDGTDISIYSDTTHRIGLSKVTQMENMIAEFLMHEASLKQSIAIWGITIKKAYFLDDDPGNIKLVQTAFANMECKLIDNKIGLTESDLPVISHDDDDNNDNEPRKK